MRRDSRYTYQAEKNRISRRFRQQSTNDERSHGFKVSFDKSAIPFRADRGKVRKNVEWVKKVRSKSRAVSIIRKQVFMYTQRRSSSANVFKVKYVYIRFSLQSAVLSTGEVSSDGENNNLVENCECPQGYTGLSCENCAWGYVKLIKNGSDYQDHHVCVKCDCNGHASTCDLVLGECTVSIFILYSYKQLLNQIFFSIIRVLFYKIIILLVSRRKITRNRRKNIISNENCISFVTMC